MDAKLIIQARIEELEQEMKGVVALIQNTPAPDNKDEQFRLVADFKDKVLTIKSGIAELKHIKELL